MESSIILSAIQKKFTAALSDYYPETEIRSVFQLVCEQLLSYSKIDILLRASEPISALNAEKFDQILKRLIHWEPIQYILGNATFYGRLFQVDNRVLIPRQETEELVDWIIKSENGNSTILDLGCGSGIIAISLALQMKDAFISACDVSTDALDVTAINAKRLSASLNIFLFDILDDDAVLPQKYQIIVSNPPYVREQEKLMMSRNVLDFEPSLALFVPDHDPLLYYKRIAILARKYLCEGGSLYFEINEYFGSELSKVLQDTGFYSIQLKNDLNGKNRMIRAKK
jgi:release factor glutamine methyltransferase